MINRRQSRIQIWATISDSALEWYKLTHFSIYSNKISNHVQYDIPVRFPKLLFQNFGHIILQWNMRTCTCRELWDNGTHKIRAQDDYVL